MGDAMLRRVRCFFQMDGGREKGSLVFNGYRVSWGRCIRSGWTVGTVHNNVNVLNAPELSTEKRLQW